jgi:hypothetical protein
MTFSSECVSYIAAHACAKSEEREVLDLLKKYLPVSSSSIDWSGINKKKEVNDVGRAGLSSELKSLATSMGATIADIFYVINVDDAVPVLKTSLSEWLRFVGELDFVDTIFISESGEIIIHWDFYMNLHTTII